MNDARCCLTSLGHLSRRSLAAGLDGGRHEAGRGGVLSPGGQDLCVTDMDSDGGVQSWAGGDDLHQSSLESLVESVLVDLLLVGVGGRESHVAAADLFGLDQLGELALQLLSQELGEDFLVVDHVVCL